MPLEKSLEDSETELKRFHIKKEDLPDKMIEIGNYLKKVPYKWMHMSVSSACNYNNDYTVHVKQKKQ
jgi:hypothetical protein